MFLHAHLILDMDSDLPDLVFQTDSDTESAEGKAASPVDVCSFVLVRALRLGLTLSVHERCRYVSLLVEARQSPILRRPRLLVT